MNNVNIDSPPNYESVMGDNSDVSSSAQFGTRSVTQQLNEQPQIPQIVEYTAHSEQVRLQMGNRIPDVQVAQSSKKLLREIKCLVCIVGALTFATISSSSGLIKSRFDLVNNIHDLDNNNGTDICSEVDCNQDDRLASVTLCSYIISSAILFVSVAILFFKIERTEADTDR